MLSSVELKQLRAFLAVAEAKTFTRAAEQVNLSQPALTHRIQQLEAALGVTLFERGARGVTLTAAGGVLQTEARLVLAAAEQAGQRVRQAAGLDAEVLSVGFDVVEMGNLPPMPSLLSRFRSRFPERQVRLEVWPPERLAQEILQERLDIAFAFGPVPPDLAFYPLLEGAYHVALPRAHPLAQEERLRLTDVAVQPLLLPSLNASTNQAVTVFLRSTGQALKVVHAGVDIGAARGLLAAGEGVAVLPSGILSGWSSPELAVKPFEDAPFEGVPLAAPRWVFGLTWKRQRPPPQAELAQSLIREWWPQVITV